MSESVSGIAYLVASICFIMALRGLSSPATARAGNLYAIAGMVIAVVTTLALPGELKPHSLPMMRRGWWRQVLPRLVASRSYFC